MKAKRFLRVVLCIILMLTLLPMNTRALTTKDLFKAIESTQGGLTITWYSALRFPANISERLVNLINLSADIYSHIDEEASKKAYNDRDRSVCLGSEPFSVDSYNADKWLPTGNSTSPSNARNCYVWGEVSGYIKVPYESELYYDLNGKAWDVLFDYYSIDKGKASGLGKWGTLSGTWDNRNYGLGENRYVIKRGTKEGEMIPFTLYIGKMRIEPNEKIGTISIDTNVSKNIYHYERIPAANFYSQLSLKDMQSFFVFNPDDYTLTLDPIHKTFPVQDYEYGIVAGDINDYSVATATGFQPLQLGVNYVTPDSGTLVIRHKSLMVWYISVATTILAKPRNVAIIQRTPTTCTLSWKVPLQIVPDDYKIRYDIYRRETGYNPKLIFSLGMAISKEYAQVDSTTDLTFTDNELKYDRDYEYFVKAAYPTGFSPPSDIVNTDSMVMEQIPSAPTDLKAVLVNQTASKVDLKISWSEPQLRRGYRGKGNSTYYPIKEYIIYRKVTNPVKWSISFIDPQEIARTKDTSYIDLGRDPYDECEYYVQSVESTGNISYFSSPLMVSIQNLIARTPKITPDTLKINNGDTVGLVVQYDDSYTGEMPGTWSVADSTIVSVEESNTEPITINPKHTIPGTIGAKVTGLKPGTTTVTFTNAATGISRDCKVEVIPAFKITPDPLTVYTDETGSLAVTYDDGYKGQRFGSWSVDDNTIASIDQNGVVTGKKAGTANVTFAGGENIETAGWVNIDTASHVSIETASHVSIETASRVKSAYDIVKTVSVVVKQGTLTVNFDPNGGSPKPESVTVRHDTTVARPADPSMSDRQFLGWFTAPQGGLVQFGTGNLLANGKMVKKWDFTNDKVTEDMTLYAWWGLRPEPSSGSSIHRPLPSWPHITGPDTINLLEGYAGNDQAYTFGGYPAPTYGISDTEPNTANAALTGNTLTIPAGLDIGSYVVTLTATNPAGTVTKTVTVNVSPAETAPTITGPDTIDLLEGFESFEQEYTFGGYPAPTYGISDTEPNTANATLTGNTLTIPGGLDVGSYVVTLYATNSEGAVTKTITVNVSPAETPAAPTIDGTDTIDLTVGYDGADETYTFGGYPAPTYGISDTEPNTANATLTGNTLTIPSGLDVGSYEVTLYATNSEGTVTKTITVNVNPATIPTIDGPDTLNLLLGYGNIDQEYTFDGDPLPTDYGISPTEPNIAGATFTGNTLTITDSPGTDIGSYEVTLYAENSAGTTTKIVTVNIFSIDFGTGIEYDLSRYDNRIEALGGAGGEFTYTLDSGSMPPGLTLNSDGTITGSADEGDYGPVSVVITDGAGNSITIENLPVHVYD